MTADVNRKGVLDVDTVKGCTAGMRASPDGGCYGACYALKIARFRNIDFGVSVVRRTISGSHAAAIARTVELAPYGFFRVGTMGEPSYAWEHTVRTIHWLSTYAIPVVVTKHWTRMTDEQLQRLVACGTIMNTSVSALDTPAQLEYRLSEIMRYRDGGGVSVARVVSCEFDTTHPQGEICNHIQEMLFTLDQLIDNPLRVPRTHPLVRDGIIKTKQVHDLNSVRTLSVARKTAYVGHCEACTDRCGLAFCNMGHPKPAHPQFSLF